MSARQAQSGKKAKGLTAELSAEARGTLFALLNHGNLRRFDSTAYELVSAGLAEVAAGRLRATRVALAWKARLGRMPIAWGTDDPRAPEGEQATA